MPSELFQFNVLAREGRARTGVILTPRGDIRTPAFMPVGTAGTVKAMYADQVRDLGADIILGNVYHLMLRPGAERVSRLGGLHKMAKWPYPILTDSGGFQVMSLGNLRKITERGVTFRSHIDGSSHELTPERSIEIQGLLGSDIQMQLDECVRLPCTYQEASNAMELSLRWAERCKAAFGTQPGKALFGIVQGGADEKLRVMSANALVDMDLKGYAIGGLAVGEPQDVMLRMIDVVEPHLPAAKPRSLMGVGTPDDILESVLRGIDMFDCVMPTRNARNGMIFTTEGIINIKNEKWKSDFSVIDPFFAEDTHGQYTKAYLRHLIRCEEMLGPMIASVFNLRFYLWLVGEARKEILAGTFTTWKNRMLPQFMNRL